MKKHFLLLVMALMSLTGWAQTATIGEVAIGNYTYGDALATDAVVKDSEGAILVKGTHYTISAGAFSDEACTTAIETSAMKANGTKYYRLITGINAYVGQSKAVWFTAGKRPLTITYTASLDRTYGDEKVALDPSKFAVEDASQLKFGATFNDGAATDIKKGSAPTGYSTADDNAGTAKAVTFVGGWTADNYTLTYTATLDIDAKALTTADLTFGDVADREYDGTDTAPTISVKYGEKVLTQGVGGAKPTGDYYVTAGTSSDLKSAKAQKVNVVLHNNYSGTFNNVKTYNITKKRVNVTVATITKEYSKTDYNGVNLNADATFEFSGIASADASKAAEIKAKFVTTAATVKATSAAEVPGNYALTIAGVTNSGSGTDLAANYLIDDASYIPATLTITQKELKLKANDASKKVGETDPTFTLATTTGITTDAITGVTFTRAKGEDPAKYDITPDYSAAKVQRTVGTVVSDVTAYYKFAIDDTKGKLTIEQGGIVVTIKDNDKFYGAKDPEFTYSVAGLQAGDKLGDFTITRSAGEKPGTYSLTATIANPDPDKYKTLTVSEGIFTIKKAQLEFTIPTQNVAKEVDKTALKKDGITVAGINNSDVAANLYDLDFNASTVTLDAGKTDANETVDDGIVATLSTGNLTVDGVAVAITDLYEIVAGNPKAVVPAAYGKLIVGTGTWTYIPLKRADKADIDDTAIGGNNDAAAQIKKHAGEKISIGFSAYEMLPEKWYPLVFPFETTVAEISQAFNYAVVNVLNKANTDPKKISFKLHMGTIPANTPFVVKVYGDKVDDYKVDMANAGFYSQIVAPSDYAAVTTADAVDASGVKFIGTYTGKTDGFRSNQYYFSASADYNQYYQGNATNTTYLRPLGAYLEVPSNEAGARIIELEEADGTITAIQVARTDNGAANNAEGWYTIGGVKLQGAPTQKGVYIQNGKKVIVK